MPTKLNVTELDYDKIRSNLKAYFTRPGSVFSDWDFEGSGLSNLLDVLAYNTHYNAMLAHMTLNEGFINSAQLRESVVSHAKLLGYNPRSKRAASGEISVFFPASSTSTDKLTLPRGTKFSTILNGAEYIFITNETSVSSRAKRNNGEGYYFNNLVISQGILKREAFLVDETNENQKFPIEDLDVDISSLKVFVRDYVGSTSVNVFYPFSSLESTDEKSSIYFISENYNGRYEITFGDGVVGKKVENTQIVELEYISTLGSEANGAGGREGTTGNWTYVTGALESDAINFDEEITILTNRTCSGGGDREGIESIRFNAPISFIAQNRAVTANDYISLIQKEFGAVDAINVWGGEDNDPITPSGAGKVYISIKPADDISESGQIITRSKLSSMDKKKILSILDSKRVITLKNQFVDPDYTNLFMDVFVKFDPNKTSLTSGELKSQIISNVISNYREKELQKFNGVFRYSKFLSSIDNFDPSILNSFARIYLYKNYDNSVFEWSNIKSMIQRIEYVPGTSQLDDKIIFHTFEDLDLVTGMTITAFNLQFTNNNRKGSFENKKIKIETDFSFSVNGFITDGTSNVTFPDLLIGSEYPTESNETSTLFGDVWLNRSCDFSPNTIDFSNGLFRGQDKNYPLLECGTWEYTYRAESGYPTEVIPDGIQGVVLNNQSYYSGKGKGLIPATYTLPIVGNGTGATITFTVDSTGSINPTPSTPLSYVGGSGYTYASIDTSGLLYFPEGNLIGDAGGAALDTVSFTGNTQGFKPGTYVIPIDGDGEGGSIQIIVGSSSSIFSIKILERGENYTFTSPIDFDQIDKSVLTGEEIEINNLTHLLVGSNYTATVETKRNHGYVSGQSVVISGVEGTNADLFNKTAVITVVDPSTFTYVLNGNPGGTHDETNATTVLAVIEPSTISGRNPSEGLLVSTNAKFNISVLEKVTDSLSGKVKLVDEAIEDSQSSLTYGKRNVYLINPDLSMVAKTFATVTRNGNIVTISENTPGFTHDFAVGEKLKIEQNNTNLGIITVTAITTNSLQFSLSGDSTSSITVQRVTNNVYGFTGTDTKIPVGMLDVSRGIVSLYKPITNIPLSENDIVSGSTFRINAVPDSNDIAPKRNQLLDINLLETNVSVEIDTIATGGSSGSIGYNTFKKNRNSDDDKTVIN